MRLTTMRHRLGVTSHTAKSFHYLFALTLLWLVTFMQTSRAEEDVDESARRDQFEALGYNVDAQRIDNSIFSGHTLLPTQKDWNLICLLYRDKSSNYISSISIDGHPLMRTSERIAVLAVAAMAMPAALAFPALGLWYLTKIWPTLVPIDRGLLGVGIALFVIGVPCLFWWHVCRLKQQPAKISFLSKLAVLYAPIALGGWSLTHKWGPLLSGFVWAAILEWLILPRPDKRLRTRK